MKVTREKDVALSPRVEIKEDEKLYDIKAEVPGIARDDINVIVKQNDLIITGKRGSEVKRSSETSTSSEFYYGDYERIIHLNDKVDPKSVKTEYKDGIISIHLNKIESHKKNKI
jgi:HSP20 family protein